MHAAILWVFKVLFFEPEHQLSVELLLQSLQVSKHQTSNIKHQTSNKHQTPNIKHQTSNIKHQERKKERGGLKRKERGDERWGLERTFGVMGWKRNERGLLDKRELGGRLWGRDDLVPSNTRPLRDFPPRCHHRRRCNSHRP